MEKNMRVEVEFMQHHAEDSSVEFSFGPCTKSEAEALCEAINTKYGQKRWKELSDKLTHLMSADTRSWIQGTRGVYARAIPAFRYDLDITQATELVNR